MTQPINGFFPALIQSRFGKRGNFELVTPVKDIQNNFGDPGTSK